MGLALPQLAPASEDRVSGAQVIDGSLKFDNDTKTYLTRTPGSAGNRKTFTMSGWFKLSLLGSSREFFVAGTSNTDRSRMLFPSDNTLDFYNRVSSTTHDDDRTTALFRDTSSFYHVVFSIDNANTTGTIYINGEVSETFTTVNTNTYFNNTTAHYIGGQVFNDNNYYDGHISQLYLIDGLALGPGYFGFTDPLTNTWRPRKFRAEGTTVNDGTVWSSGTVTGTAANASGSGGWTQAFDGNTSNLVYPTDSNGSTKIVLPKPIRFLSNVRLYAGQNATSGTDILVNGINLSDSLSFPLSGGWLSIDHLITSPITSLELKNVGGQASNIRALEVDGVIVTDSTTTNLDFGTNGFYLPMDGNSPIGDDKSGQGNNWTPVNFGGSVALDNPQVSGARPILNVTQGGTQAGVGVFGSKQNVGYAVTVYNDGGGNKYYIDGTKQATLTGLIRGATYTFNQTDSSNSTHPLVFGTTANGNDFSNGVSITGSPGSTGITSITIPYNAPNTLYYHCSAHANMGDSITGITTNEKLADQYASNCVLAVPFVGSTDDASAGLACTSTTKADTNSGSTATNTLSNFYNGSRDFDGSNDTCSFASVTACGAGDWTVEFWVYSESSAQDTVYRRIVSTGTNAASAIQIGHIGSGAASGGYITYTHSDNSNYAVNTSSVLNRWAHIAVVRESGSVNVYTDGIKGTTADGDSGNKTGTTWYVSGYGGSTSSGRFNGKIQDLRVYPGVAKYTSDFVVPATSPDILPDTPSGVSGGSKLAKVTDGAVNFDGTGDYLNVGTSSDLALGSGDFTIESMVYVSDITQSTYPTFISNWTGSWAADKWSIHVDHTSAVNRVSFWVYNHNVNSPLLSGTTTLGENRWYHIAVVRSGNTFSAYLDGKLEVSSTSFTGSIDGGSSEPFYCPSPVSDNDFAGFLSNVRLIKGTALYTTDFTPPTSPLTDVTNTKLLCCQSNTSATAAAVAPGSITANGDAAATNFNPFNTDINTVRGQETGYPTWNPLTKSTSTLSNGNLTITTDGGSGYPIELVNTFTPKGRGQWYWEFTLSALSGSNYTLLGMIPSDSPYIQGNSNNFTNVGGEVKGFSVYVGYDGSVSAYSGAATAGSATATIGVGGVVGWAYDAENGTLKCSINGVPQGTQFTNIRTDVGWLFGVTDYDNSATASYTINFGQKPFKFPPPDGFQPLNISNIRPETVITRPDQYVGISTWTGDGTNGSGTSNDRQVTGLSFKPDIAWCKIRTQSYTHVLWDSVRGAGSNKQLQPNKTEAEGSTTGNGANTAAYGYISEFTSDGFKTLTGSNDNDYFDRLNDDYVAWCWKAGGSKNTFNVDDVGYASAAAAGLTGGSITPIGSSVGTKQGFSIIKWTATNGAATINHGLKIPPTFIMVKDLDSIAFWQVYHSSLGNTKAINLNSTNAASTATNHWNNTSPTSTTFSVGVNSNYLTDDHIAYLWHDVPGLQKFGVYTGNENTSGDGPFVELGFRPAIIWIKNADQGTSAADWVIYDSERNKFNPSGKQLYPNRNIAEADSSSHYFDILSNGFKVRSTSTSDLTNATDTYIYCAWAEAPTFNLFGGQSNAR